ncbi:MAG: low molecular weight phosphotyrosine protein phosphatase [Maribacter sp.]|nr:low molecular weight phosphotyrosine protein phosphatase [Maribacter sp.]
MATKILMVCLGNICRSPLAQGILEKKVDPKKIIVDSAGTGGYHLGKPPDPRSISIALKNGIDISGQRCRKFSPQDFDRFDHIYAMDRSNFRNIIAHATNKTDKAKVRLLLDALGSKNQEVPDPYYDDNDGFEKVFALINAACDALAAKL